MEPQGANHSNDDHFKQMQGIDKKHDGHVSQVTSRMKSILLFKELGAWTFCNVE
jgi:hypothetical protein